MQFSVSVCLFDSFIIGLLKPTISPKDGKDDRNSEVLPSRGSLVSPNWLMMYRGMSSFISCPSLAWSSAASSRW